MQKLITLQEARNAIEKSQIDTLEKEKIFFKDSVNRILASDIIAKYDNPQSDTSSMDGYAFAYSDLELLKTNGLNLGGLNKAGNESECECMQGSCIKTFTGAKIPKGADTMLIVEQIKILDDRIFLKDKSENIQKGAWIRAKAQSYHKNQILLYKGDRITPFHMGILAQNNDVFIEVLRKPRVAILSSGDEIAEVGEIKRDNQLYSSNNHLLDSIVTAMGAECSIFKILNDDKTTIANAIQDAIKYNDMVVTTGGMSKGDLDFTKDVIMDFGECVFKGVNIKPGKVIAYINAKNKHIIALPGNPISSVISFLLLGRAVLQKMLNRHTDFPIHKAKLKNTVIKKDSRLEFINAKATIENGNYIVEALRNQSYMVNSIQNALLIANKDIGSGEIVDIIIIDELLTL